ncbi:MAG: DUF3108 domain-containing protein [Bacteroidales bacterium]|nr:DUF3108 domain-containing protein [Bacteroidales bacterium]
MMQIFKSGILLLLTLFLCSDLIAQDEQWRKWNNEAFAPGEVLKYRFYYDAWLTGKITAGTGTLEVKTTNRKFYGREVWHIDTEGNSKGMFNWFFKVKDEFDSYIDVESVAPHYFERKTREGGYKKFDEYRFNHQEEYVMTRSDTMKIPRYTQDFVSAIYFARTFSSDTLKVGDMIPVYFFLDDSVYNSAILFDGRENIEIELGTFRCLKFRPGMATGEVFADKYPMEMWVTDDKNHLPILIKSAVIVGNVKAELMEYSGLANPLTSLIQQAD